MSETTVSNVSMKELWDAVCRSRMEVSELKGMLTMHFKDGEHHHPPCAPAATLQKTLMSALFAALLALVAALGNIVVAVIVGMR